MKMRIVSLLMVLLMLALVLTSCGMTTQASTPSPFDQRFAMEKLSRYTCVIVDKVTGVCYLAYVGGSGAGLTALMDADGTLLTYSEAWNQVFGGGQTAK